MEVPNVYFITAVVRYPCVAPVSWWQDHHAAPTAGSGVRDSAMLGPYCNVKFKDSPKCGSGVQS